MEENLEIEFKVLISEDTYRQIINDHQIDHTYSQTNYYLMHPKLSKLKYMLRIRQKDNYYELTLKQPQPQGNLETNLEIDEVTKNKIIDHQLVNNDVFELLKPLQIDSTMFKTDYSLTTTRHEIKTPFGLICLDENKYNNITDYELEYEVDNYNQGKLAFLEFIKNYHITYTKNAPSKIKRLMETLKKQC